MNELFRTQIVRTGNVGAVGIMAAPGHTDSVFITKVSVFKDGQLQAAFNEGTCISNDESDNKKFGSPVRA